MSVVDLIAHRQALAVASAAAESYIARLSETFAAEARDLANLAHPIVAVLLLIVIAAEIIIRPVCLVWSSDQGWVWRWSCRWAKASDGERHG